MELNKEDVTVNMQHLAAPVKTVVDKYQLIPEFLKVRGLVKQQLVSFNYFANIGIREIVSANSVVKCTADPEFTLRYMDVRVGVPSKSSDHATEKLTPHCCRLSDITYSAPIVANIQYMRRTNGIKKMLTKEVVIGRLPIMLRSCRCVLNGKDETELAKMGECPLDPGGYFIVKGTEKVILIQEQLFNNRIIIETDKKKRLTAKVTSSSLLTRSMTKLVVDKEKIYVELNSFTGLVPIMVVMKAMGMESDQEVVQMIGRDPRYASLLLPSIQEAAALNVFTRQQALENLEKVQVSCQYLMYIFPFLVKEQVNTSSGEIFLVMLYPGMTRMDP